MSFANLALHAHLLRATERLGFENATEVQAQSIPLGLEGHDLLVSSHTGSGKTIAFLLPILHRMFTEREAQGALSKAAGRLPYALVLAPTRELAQQVEQVARDLSDKKFPIRTVCLVGGAPFGPQFKGLQAGADIIVATPGRLMDHMQRGKADLSGVKALVLDEADRMLDMGFIDDIYAITEQVSKDRQTLLFSATLDGIVGQLAREVTRSPKRIAVARDDKGSTDGVPDRIEQRLYFADNIGHKVKLLDHFLRDPEVQQAVVFAATKAQVDDLQDKLLDEGFSVDALHGDMQQGARNRTLKRLREGRAKILVATDVAARGLDISTITHVFNFDLPRQTEDYVHRIGRTGRAGREGIAISLAGHSQKGLVRDIERYTKQRIFVDVVPGLEPTPKAPGKGEVKFKMGESRKSSFGAPGRKAPGYPREAAPKSRAPKPTDFSSPRGPRPDRASFVSDDVAQTIDKPRRVSGFGKSAQPAQAFEKKPFERKTFEQKPFERKPFEKDSFDKKPFEKKSFEKKPFEKKSFEKTPFEKKPFERKPFEERSFDKKPGEAKLWASKTFDKKPYEKKAFEKPPFEKKPFEKKPFEKKPFGAKPFDSRPPAKKSFGGGVGAKPATKGGFAKPSEPASRPGTAKKLGAWATAAKRARKG